MQMAKPPSDRHEAKAILPPTMDETAGLHEGNRAGKDKIFTICLF